MLVALLFVLVSSAISATDSDAEAEAWKSHTLEVLVTTQRLLSAVQDAETGQRGYLLTSENRYLTPYEAGVTAARAELAKLKQQTADNPKQQQRLARLDELTAAKLRELALTISAARAGRHAEALGIVRSGEGKALMETIRTTIGSVMAEEERLLAQRATEQASTKQRERILILASLAAVLLLAAGLAATMIWAVRSTLKARQTADRVRAAEALGAANTALVRSARELAEANSLLESIVQTSPDPIYLKDTEGRLRVANEATAHALGLPASDMIGRRDRDFLPPQLAESIEAADRAAYAEGGITVDEAVPQPDGEPLIFQSRKVPVRDPDGEVIGLLGISRDVTEVRRLEADLRTTAEAREALLQEVNHRVKNSLQLVTGLLALQASRAPSPESRATLEEAEARVAVVAALHQRLYKTGRHDRVEFCDFLGDLARDILTSADASARLALDVDCPEEVVLPVDQAVPLSLIVSELITNSVKYGFPEDRNGTIAVRLVLTHGHVRISVSDNGIGLPAGFDLSRPAGMGMKIVTSLARQIRATLQTSPQEQGAGFLLILPRS